jgi:threonine synthase
MFRFFYKCSECEKEFEIKPDLMVCPQCSSSQKTEEPLKGVLDIVLEGSTKQNFDIYDFLPIEKEFFPSIPVGNTPFFQLSKNNPLSNNLNVFIKNDSLNPTGSLKDRASFLVSAFAKKHNINEITVASTGNAGSSMAGIGAAANQKVNLFIPKTAPQAKLVQGMQYGANLTKVNGNYDLAFEMSLKSQKGMSRNTAYNPMTIEGKKTVSLEIFKQLGKLPDIVFVPTGDGVILSGVYKGFADLKKCNLTNKIPTIVAVQAKTSSALYFAYKNGHFDNTYSAKTIADSIAVDIPKNGYHALKYLKKYNGDIVLVSDNEILKAQHLLAKTTGVFAEPAAAASFAGFLNYKKKIKQNGTVVLLITGNGLKDINSANKGLALKKDS